MKAFVALLTAWGPLGILVLATLDSAGIPLPAAVDALVIASAIVSPASALLAASAAVVGSFGGCLFLFYVARRGGQAYLDRHASSPGAGRFREWFQTYGLISVFIPCLLPIPLPLKVFVLSAGALQVRPLSFAAVVLAARIPRYFGLAWLGAQMGGLTVGWLKAHAGELLLFALVLGIALYALVRFRVRAVSEAS